VASGLKVFSSDFGEQPGCGPDPDFRACCARPGQQGGFDPASGPRFRTPLRDHDSYLRALSAERRDLLGPTASHSRHQLQQPGFHSGAPGGLHRCR